MNSSLIRLLSASALVLIPLAAAPSVQQSQEPAPTAPAQQQSAPAKTAIAAEFLSPDALIDALYQSVTFGPGEECDFKKMEQIFLPGATFIMPPGRGEKRKIGHLKDFFADWRRFLDDPQVQEPLKKWGFNERIVNRRTDQFGDIAHSYVVFEVRFDPEQQNPLGTGVDSIQLIRIDGRWWVSSINTQFVRPNVPLPRRFLDEK